MPKGSPTQPGMKGKVWGSVRPRPITGPGSQIKFVSLQNGYGANQIVYGVEHIVRNCSCMHGDPKSLIV